MSARSIALCRHHNLNKDYDGCDLVFPEFGSRSYRAPHGGAIVFSCGALHQVTPVTRGHRYAFLAFLYGEADAALREKNDAKLVQSAFRYSGAVSDRMFRTRPNARSSAAGRRLRYRACHCLIPG